MDENLDLTDPLNLTTLDEALAWCGRRIARDLLEHEPIIEIAPSDHPAAA
jgi:hypothetical protein